MGRKLILICDDNQDLLDLLSLEIRLMFPAEVIAMRSGKKTMEFFRTTRLVPDLLIIDLVLPDLEGDDIIQMLRKGNKFKDLPIILISGIIVNIENRAKVVGADDYLLKPFSINTLRDKISNLLP